MIMVCKLHAFCRIANFAVSALRIPPLLLAAADVLLLPPHSPTDAIATTYQSVYKKPMHFLKTKAAFESSQINQLLLRRRQGLHVYVHDGKNMSHPSSLLFLLLSSRKQFSVLMMSHWLSVAWCWLIYARVLGCLCTWKITTYTLAYFWKGPSDFITKR